MEGADLVCFSACQSEHIYGALEENLVPALVNRWLLQKHHYLSMTDCGPCHTYTYRVKTLLQAS